MKLAPLSERARILAAHPDVLVEAGVILEAICARGHIENGALVAELPAWLIDRLCAWGACIEDMEQDVG